jgi:GST-like protein
MRPRAGPVRRRCCQARIATLRRMLTLYGSNGSGSAAVEMALLHCGLPYRVERASSWEADSAQAALQTVNPLGQIPTLVLEDGAVMTESAAILIDLGLTHPERHLLPSDPVARAQAIRGLVFIAANCYAAVSIIDYPERWSQPCDKNAAAHLRAGSRARLHHHWDVFAQQFVGTPFLSGAAPGALDYLAVVVSRWSGTRAHLQRTQPALVDTLRLVQAQALTASVFAHHWPKG